MQSDPRLIASCIAQTKAEILRDIRAGIVPADVASFSALHDHTDANTYGGLCDDDSPHHTIGFPADDPDGFDVDSVNAIQDAVDGWLRRGEHRATGEARSYVVGLPVVITVAPNGTVSLSVDTSEASDIWEHVDMDADEAQVEADRLTIDGACMARAFGEVSTY